MTVVALSRLVAIVPPLSRHVGGKADQLVAADDVSRLAGGDRWAHYLVGGGVHDGMTYAYRVRLELDEWVWSGQCEHWAVLGIPQARDASACSHIVAAAVAELILRGTDLPDPHQPAPPEEPVDSLEQRAYQIEGFYD